MSAFILETVLECVFRCSAQAGVGDTSRIFRRQFVHLGDSCGSHGREDEQLQQVVSINGDGFTKGDGFR